MRHGVIAYQTFMVIVLLLLWLICCGLVLLSMAYFAATAGSVAMQATTGKAAR